MTVQATTSATATDATAIMKTDTFRNLSLELQ
jgi:hypothetical protein